MKKPSRKYPVSVCVAIYNIVSLYEDIVYECKIYHDPSDRKFNLCIFPYFTVVASYDHIPTYEEVSDELEKILNEF